MLAMEVEMDTENGSEYPDSILPQEFNVSETAYIAVTTSLAVWEVAAIVVVLGLLIITTIMGNIFILIAITTHKPLRVPQNYLIASLAVSDLMVAVVVMPISLVVTVSEQWTLGHIVCNFWISMDVLYCTASILNLCIISLDRYWAITNPVKYSPKRTTKRMMLNISIVWAMSIVISITPFLGWNKDSSLEEGICEISQNMYYTIFSTFGAFYIPASIVLVVYYRISVEAKKRIRKNIPQKTLPLLLLNKSSSPGNSVTEAPDTRECSAVLQPSPKLDSTININSTAENQDQNSPPKSPDFNSNSQNKFQNGDSCRKSRRSTTSTVKSEGSINSEESQDRNLYIKRTINRNGSLRIDIPHLVSDGSSKIKDKNGSPRIDRPRLISIGSPRSSRTSSPSLSVSPSSQRSISFSFLSSPNRRNTYLKPRGSLSSIAIEERQREKRALAAAREQRATRTVFIVTGTFLVCWLPFFLAALILPLCHKCFLPQVYKIIFLWLGYCNSMLNPIIYTVFNKDFKDAFKKMLHFGAYKRGLRSNSITKRSRWMLFCLNALLHVISL